MTDHNPAPVSYGPSTFCKVCGSTVAHTGKEWIHAAALEASEIHNRFCGENGEPCQVCRLKAEREAK